jgi:bacteriocin biosynthesis cyclodehydratase domain-containing protein
MSTIPHRPLLKPWYRTAREERRLVFEYGQSVVVLEGRAAARLLPALLPLLDGARTAEEVAAAFDEPLRPAVLRALATLAERGLLTEGPAVTETSQGALDTAELLAALGEAPPADVHERLAGTRLAVLGASPAAELIVETLRASGVGSLVRPRDWIEACELDAAVVAPCGRELTLLAQWNERALRTATAWLQVLPFDGRAAVVGPLYVPGETCCYECYLRRRMSVVDYPDELRLLERVDAPYPPAPALETVAAGLAAFGVLRWLAAGDGFLPGFLYLLEFDDTFALSGHVVYRVPRCPVCARVAGAAAPPLPWHGYVADGAY